MIKGGVLFPRAIAWLPVVLLATTGCYDQPVISRDKPLTCAADVPTECPTGFTCVANRFCAPRSCNSMTNPCPVGLVCAGSRCQLPGSDGGAGEVDRGGIVDGPGGDGPGADLFASADGPAADLATPSDAPADGGGN